MAHALLADDHVEVRTSWNEKALISQVPGARYQGDSTWYVPLTWGSCVVLRGVFQGQLVVAPELDAWAWDDRRTRIERALAFRDLLDYPTWPELGPLGDWLYPFQRAGVAFLTVAGDALLADEMGTGKTVQVLSALRLRGEAAFPALVVCPNSVKYHWARLARTWAPDAKPYVLDRGVAGARKLLDQAREDPAALVVVNFESVRLLSRLAPYGSVKLKRCRECDPRYGDETLKASTCHVHVKELNGFGFRSAVLDEAHRIKDPQSQVTRAVWATFWDESIRVRWGTTGTPIVRHVADLWSIMHALAPYEYPTKTAFMERFALTSWNAFGGTDVVGVRPDTKAELYAFLDPRFRRMLKAVVLPQLPPKVREQRWVDLEAAQKKIYTEMHDRLVTELPDGELLVAPSNLAAQVRLLQLASSSLHVEKPDPDDVSTWVVRLRTPSPKLDALEEVLEEMGDEPCVIAALHKQLIDLAAERLTKLRVPHLLITGDVAPVDRDRALAELAAGRVRCVLFTIQAGGTGLDMSSVDTMIRLQRSWSLADERQTEDRIHRIGSERHRSVKIVDIVTRGTVEEKQIERLYERMERLDEITRDRAALVRAGVTNTAALDAEEARLLRTGLDRPLEEAA